MWSGFSVQEKLILRKLKFRLNAATPYVFMVRFLKAAQSDTEVSISACMVYRCTISQTVDCTNLVYQIDIVSRA